MWVSSTTTKRSIWSICNNKTGVYKHIAGHKVTLKGPSATCPTPLTCLNKGQGCHYRQDLQGKFKKKKLEIVESIYPLYLCWNKKKIDLFVWESNESIRGWVKERKWEVEGGRKLPRALWIGFSWVSAEDYTSDWNGVVV